jgi:hypothetical protein
VSSGRVALQRPGVRLGARPSLRQAGEVEDRVYLGGAPIGALHGNVRARGAPYETTFSVSCLLTLMQVGLLFTPPFLAYVFSENDGAASHRKGG